jgi:hypothetical protein
VVADINFVANPAHVVLFQCLVGVETLGHLLDGKPVGAGKGSHTFSGDGKAWVDKIYVLGEKPRVQRSASLGFKVSATMCDLLVPGLLVGGQHDGSKGAGANAIPDDVKVGREGRERKVRNRRVTGVVQRPMLYARCRP